ncbi:DNA and RNA helicase [Paenibacillus sp. FSL K6-1230]|uniref:DNA and RNA helicase n=1 Tax=Paenibacillus sp. FSL K6-1230 TaxID=2921603 RepID=UPI0030F8E998
MLVNKSPRFEKGRILKTEMLENLRDYPRRFLDIRYEEYSDGIIAGMKVSVEHDHLIIGRGIVKHDGHLYLLEQAYELPYAAANGLSILKIRFHAQQAQHDFVTREAEIILTKGAEEADGESGRSQSRDPVRELENVNFPRNLTSEPGTTSIANEIELGRFKLKEGAALRSDYQDFADMATEFNTWSAIRAPYAAWEQPTLRPEITSCFATELLRCRSAEALDTSFALLCLNSERVQREALLQYLCSRGGEYRDYTNGEMHRQLVLILQEVSRGGRGQVRWSGQSGGNRMIVD